jgi:prolyl-tRNA editing enzyme YbaK/EbsC (Cys-tRNA(Pro) deacylase)
MPVSKEFKELVRRLGGEILELDAPVKTVEQAARATGADPGQIIKSILLITEGGRAVLAIVDGRSRINLKKVEKKFGRARLASSREVKEVTGYEVGELPPIGIPVKTLIDLRVLERSYVLGGGGAMNRLIRIDPRKIAEVQNAEVEDISAETR